MSFKIFRQVELTIECKALVETLVTLGPQIGELGKSVALEKLAPLRANLLSAIIGIDKVAAIVASGEVIADIETAKLAVANMALLAANTAQHHPKGVN